MTPNEGGSQARLHIVVFCWPRVYDNVIHICQSVNNLGHRVTVIDASGRAPCEIRNCHWVSINSDWYYGSKFYYAAKLFDGDLLLQIQGDAYSDNWEAVIAACLERFAAFPHLGVWSPEFDNTGWPTRNVFLGPIPGSDLAIVSQTDCIVWALRREVVDFLLRLDYTDNNLGWGIDWAAMVGVYGRALIAVRDQRITISHAAGKGYEVEEAYRQMFAFLNQLTPPQKALLAVILKSCGQTPFF
jgi:hypothetical protein